MKTLIETYIPQGWQLLCNNLWINMLVVCVAFLLSFIVTTIITKLIKDKISKQHISYMCLIITSFGAGFGANVLYYTLTNTSTELLTLLSLTAIEYVSVLISLFIWELLINSFIILISSSVRNHKAKINKPVQKTTEQVISDNIQHICTLFTRNWIRDHIAVDKTRTETLTNNKKQYISKLSASLVDVCEDAELVATKYYDYCLKQWK